MSINVFKDAAACAGCIGGCVSEVPGEEKRVRPFGDPQPVCGTWYAQDTCVAGGVLST